MGFVFTKEAAESFDWWRRSAAGHDALAQECELIRRILSPQIGESILDVGCGSGFHLRVFREWGMRPVGIDASEAMVELARQRLGFDIPVIHGFAQKLPFPERHFDIVSFITTLEFIDSPSDALREAFRVARKKIVVVILNAYSWGGVSTQIEGLFKENVYQQAKLLNLWKLKKIIRRHGRFCSIRWGSSRAVPLLPGSPARSRSSGGKVDSPFARFIALCAELAVPARVAEPAVNPAILAKVPSWAQRSLQVRA